MKVNYPWHFTRLLYMHLRCIFKSIISRPSITSVERSRGNRSKVGGLVHIPFLHIPDVHRPSLHISFLPYPFPCITHPYHIFTSYATPLFFNYFYHTSLSHFSPKSNSNVNKAPLLHIYPLLTCPFLTPPPYLTSLSHTLTTFTFLPQEQQQRQQGANAQSGVHRDPIPTQFSLEHGVCFHQLLLLGRTNSHVSFVGK